MKPCRSPYCECTPHQCQHPGFYDARHLPYTHPKPFNPCQQCETQDHCERRTCIYTMKPTHQTAYNYCMAMITQRAAEDQLNTALRSLGSDNYIFSLCQPLENAYNTLVAELLGPQLFDWLMWWMYETDCGKRHMEFSIDGVEYDPTTMTLYRFLEIVDANA
jgi:hypothetical protein